MKNDDDTHIWVIVIISIATIIIVTGFALLGI